MVRFVDTGKLSMLFFPEKRILEEASSNQLGMDKKNQNIGLCIQLYIQSQKWTLVFSA